MPEGGGEGGPRDEVGTLNVIAHPTWGILANFEHKCWPRDRFEQCKMTKARGGWIRMFRHLESTQNFQKFKLSTIRLSFCDTWLIKCSS